MKRYYVRAKGKYKQIPYYDFPGKPADGYWIVQGNSRGWVCRVKDLPRYNVKALDMLERRKENIAAIIVDAYPMSPHNIASLIVAYLASNPEWTRDDMKLAVATTRAKGYYAAQG